MAEDNEIDMNETVNMGKDTITLAELAGLSMDDIAEKRGEAFPKGVFNWEVDSEAPPHLAIFGEGEKKAGFAVFKLKCLEVLTVSDNEFTGDSNDLVGKFHNENFRLGSEDSLGFLKAFLVDIGAPSGLPLIEQLKGCAGLRFQAPISRKIDKNDSDKTYTNINRNKGKIKRMAGAAGSDVAAAVAA